MRRKNRPDIMDHISINELFIDFKIMMVLTMVYQQYWQVVLWVVWVLITAVVVVVVRVVVVVPVVEDLKAAQVFIDADISAVAEAVAVMMLASMINPSAIKL